MGETVGSACEYLIVPVIKLELTSSRTTCRLPLYSVMSGEDLKEEMPLTVSVNPHESPPSVERTC